MGELDIMAPIMENTTPGRDARVLAIVEARTGNSSRCRTLRNSAGVVRV